MGQPGRDAQQHYWKAAARLSGCMMVVYGLLGLVLLVVVGVMAYTLFGVAGALAVAAVGAVLVALVRWAS